MNQESREDSTNFERSQILHSKETRVLYVQYILCIF